MGRRFLLCSSPLGLGLLVLAGCRGEQSSTSPPAKQAVLRAGFDPAPVGARPPVKLTAVQKPPLEITPGSSTITADDAGLQLLASRKEDGSVHDLTAQVKWTLEPAGLAEIEQGGYLRPVAPGDATVKAELDGQSATATVKLEPRSPRPWDFGHDIMPVLSRLGCNTGGCHGRASGQNGFHLSIFGYDSQGDFLALARDAGSRRVSKFSPKDSLFLAKATGRMAHGGGPRLKVGSPEYQTLLAWVADGAPETRGKARGALVKLTVPSRGDPGGARPAAVPRGRAIRRRA
jgi:hypothetical protein